MWLLVELDPDLTCLLDCTIPTLLLQLLLLLLLIFDVLRDFNLTSSRTAA